VFVCENNGYAEFTSREEHSNVKLVRVSPHPMGIATQTIDGNDLRRYLRCRSCHRDPARGAGPYLLECMTSYGGTLTSRLSAVSIKRGLAGFRRNVP